ncbi:MAG: hypothetical protein VX309_09965, partial [Pseudomonadota bacterium]|nr:hypothetical protein [Pseudomonadota bacterium]
VISTAILFYAAMAGSLLLSCVALFAALREPGWRFRLPWAVLALVGVGGGAAAWQDPAEIYWFFGVALPTVSYSAVPGSWEPQTLRVLFPLGAFAVLLRVALHRRISPAR